MSARCGPIVYVAASRPAPFRDFDGLRRGLVLIGEVVALREQLAGVLDAFDLAVAGVRAARAERDAAIREADLLRLALVQANDRADAAELALQAAGGST